MLVFRFHGPEGRALYRDRIDVALKIPDDLFDPGRMSDAQIKTRPEQRDRFGVKGQKALSYGIIAHS